MKTWLLLLVCYAALLLALAVFGVSTQAGELLTNGGFEQGTAGWAANPGDLNVSADAYSGAASGKLSGAGLYTYRVYQWVNVGSGGSYELAGRLKDGGNVQRAFLELTWFDAAGSAIGSQLVSADMMPGASGWQFLSTGSGIAPASATSARAAVVVRPFNSDPFALLMDDLSLQGSTPPPPSPTPTETATPTPGVTPKPTLPPGPPSPPSQPSPSPTNTSTPYPSPSPTSTPFPDPTEPAPTPESEPDYFSALVNSSFEIASNDGRPYGWRKFGGELNRGEELSWEGRFSAVLSSATASSKWVYQTVSVSGGRFYVFSGHAYK
ncbi:MAG TPA: hypothetical protein VNL15_03235, partial [Dehalococcoidia bacterium]|nr:hypothetical protein [Dehalococcoidia bacterium]